MKLVSRNDLRRTLKIYREIDLYRLHINNCQWLAKPSKHLQVMLKEDPLTIYLLVRRIK